MGSLSSKTYSPTRNNTERNSRNHYMGFTQFSLANFVGNLSGISVRSGSTSRSVNSVSRPWSKWSRCRWHESTLNNPFESAKTAWPVPYIEALFLPEFRINGEITESSFKVLGLISKGAFGKVYKVEFISDGKVYAMKILKKSKIVQENYINQVKDEVKIQKICGHNPFIVNCPYHWQSKRKIFIVTEYLDGGDLYTLCDKYGALPEDLARVYIAELALALDFLHNAGIVYRDLKLENVLLDSDGHVFLIDFGLSKWLNYGDKTNTLCGTLQYMAPEIFAIGSYGHAVDWWSLGILACFLLTNKFAEGGSSKICGELPKQATLTLSAGARDLLCRLLHPEPGKRLRSLLTLQTIPFFMGFSFPDLRARKTCPRELREKWFIEEKKIEVELKEDDVFFYDFDSMSATIV